MATPPALPSSELISPESEILILRHLVAKVVREEMVIFRDNTSIVQYVVVARAIAGNHHHHHQ
jgi:hypothetical protein